MRCVKMRLILKHLMRKFSSYQEKKLSVSEEHKPYVRSKRNLKNLPNSYTDTRWIPKIKSWKHASKAKHQYEKGTEAKAEVEAIKDPWYEEKLILRYKLSKLKPDEWLYINVSDRSARFAANEMLLANEIEGFYEVTVNEFYDFNVKKLSYEFTLTYIRKKVDNKDENN